MRYKIKKKKKITNIDFSNLSYPKHKTKTFENIYIYIKLLFLKGQLLTVTYTNGYYFSFNT